MKRPPIGAEIVLGSHNKKKVLELRDALSPVGLQLVSLAEIEDAIEVDETGTTFIENARLKATQQAKHLNRWVIGEDSGLCVPGIKGEPGVYSARYSGPEATDAMNNEKLLREMQELKGSKRRAYYVCTMSLASPEGEICVEAEGRCWGRIIDEYRGAGGFGYDPLFEIEEYHQTFAELGASVKRVLSHRGRAVRAFLRNLSLV